jgi:hypothetical protein
MEIDKSSGYIKIYRKMLEWEWYDDINTFKLFIHLLLKANHSDNKWRGIQVKRGQLITSYDKLSKQTKLSQKKIRTALKRLKSTGEVASQSTNNYSIITINNYDIYQQKDKPKGKQGASEGQAEGKQRATNNNDKNEKNDKEDILLWWNELATKYGLAKIDSITKVRKSHLNARLKEKEFNLDKISKKIEQSKFLQEGKSDSNWRFNFDWFIKNDTNYVKILEGKYDDKNTNKKKVVSKYDF